MVPQPCRLVREQSERGRVRLREAEAREGDELVVELVRLRLLHPFLLRSCDEPLPPRLERRLGALAAHRPPQPLGLADGEAGEMDGDVEHLVLEDDDAERLSQRLLEQRVVGRRAVARIVAQQLAPLDVWVHGLPLDRPRPHERDLHRDVVDRLRPRAEDDLHLRAALDLEAADRVRCLDLREHVRVVEPHAREVDPLATVARDQVDALLDCRQHPEAEQVDLEEAGVGAGVLVPLAHLPALHRRRLYRHELDERPRGDDHPARVLRDVARQAGDLGAEGAERAPARRAELRRRVGQRSDLVGDALRVPAVGEPGEPLEVGVREAERLADVPDRAARAVGREGRYERSVLLPVALDDADYELLADVAREVEVDVRHRRELAVEEAAEREVVRDRVDVREARQVADERADRGAAAAAGRQDVPHRAGAAHLERHLARELEHLPVEQEEAGETELVDQRELVLEPPADAALVAVEVAVALRERALADAAQLDDRRLVPVREVRVAVAELLGQVELEALGQPGGLLDGFSFVRKAVTHLLRRQEDGLVVAAPFPLAALERGAAADGDEHVLERSAAAVVCVDVTGRDRADAERGGEVAQVRVAAFVAALVRALQLDVEAVASEGAREPCCRVRSADREPVARAAGEADESLVQLLEQRLVERAAAAARGSSCRACARAPRSAAGRGSRSRVRSRRAA